MIPPTEEQVRILSDLAGIKIAPEHLPGVTRNLEIVLAQAALLFEPPIDLLVEPATTFSP